MESKEEIPLHGGWVNRVVRVGDTVRRMPGPGTPTVHRLLAHVRGRGIRWVPEPLGYDGLGREVLGYLPGVVPHDTPVWLWSEAVLTDAARALRDWHDATVGFEHAPSTWGLAARHPPEVVCHNDFAPYNCVFRQGRLVGVIDFDTCAPGPRLWDIAYTAYRFVPLCPASGVDSAELSPFGHADTWARLETFLEAYSAGDYALRYPPSAVVATAIERLHALAQWTAQHGDVTGAAELAHHASMYQRHALWLGSAFPAA